MSSNQLWNDVRVGVGEPSQIQAAGLEKSVIDEVPMVEADLFCFAKRMILRVPAWWRSGMDRDRETQTECGSERMQH